MDRKNGLPLPLALVKSVSEYDMNPTGTPSVASTKCEHCGGTVTERKNGTAYCCDAAELAVLRSVVAELDQRLACELEDPPLDAHLARFLTYARARVHRARRRRDE
jgi:hypothetical protein